MTGRERVAAMLRGEPTDILPRVPILMAFAARHIGQSYAAFAADHRVLAEANLRCAEDFDFDQLSAISDPYRETAAFGAELAFRPDGPPHCLRPPLADAKDPALLARPDPATSERLVDRVAGVRAMSEAGGDRFSVLGWVEGPAAEAADLRGVTSFLMDLIEDPPFAAALMDRCTEVAVDFARAQVAAGADMIGLGDAIASQLSPALYAEHVLPRERRIVEAVHRAGAAVRLHICGDITHLLAHLPALGADLIDLDWQVEMRRAREALGDGQALAGNLDPAEAVLRSTPEAIRRALEEIYREVGPPYFAGAGCEIPAATPPANLRALCAPIPYASGT